MCKRTGNWSEQREELSCCAIPKTAYANERMLFRVACHWVEDSWVFTPLPRSIIGCGVCKGGRQSLKGPNTEHPLLTALPAAGG